MNDLIISREAAAHRGRRLEYFTIAWNSLEGLIGIGAGMIAGSVSTADISLLIRARRVTLRYCMNPDRSRLTRL